MFGVTLVHTVNSRTAKAAYRDSVPKQNNDEKILRGLREDMKNNFKSNFLTQNKQNSKVKTNKKHLKVFNLKYSFKSPLFLRGPTCVDILLDVGGFSVNCVGVGFSETRCLKLAFTNLSPNPSPS